MKDNPPKLTANDILKLLVAKGSSENAVCFPECYTGSSWDKRGYGKFDLWTMARRYSSPMMTGYEIKVNRQDFVGDKKWRTKYLRCCHRFFFACPEGLIDPDELDDGIGLYVVSQKFYGQDDNGQYIPKLERVKAAKRRDIEPPVDLLMSIIINRRL